MGTMSEPSVRITTHTHFSAAHRLHNDARDPEWNRRVFDKCNRVLASTALYVSI